MVRGGRPEGRAGRLHADEGHDGHPPARLRGLGEHPEGPRPPHQGLRARQRLFPAVHPRGIPQEGGRARRRVLARGGLGDDRRQGGARGEAGRAADLRGHHRPHVLQVDQILAGPARAHQPVGEHRPLGEGHPAFPANDGIPLAGRPYMSRDGRGRGGRDAPDPRPLQGRLRVGAGHPGPLRTQVPAARSSPVPR